MENMKRECHELAEHILRKQGGMKWLRKEIVEMLLDPGNIEELAADYADYCATLEIQEPA